MIPSVIWEITMIGQRRLRSSRQRTVVLDALRDTTSHPTADEIYAVVRAEMPRISLGTVYRNLETLAELGEVQKLEFAGVQRRYDGCTSPHLHVRCDECGRVADVKSAPLPKIKEVIPADLETEFKVTGMRLELSGICPDCVG